MTFIQDAANVLGMGDNPKCALCGADIGEFRYNSMPQWNVSGMLCSHCYDKKLLEHYIAPDRRGVTKK
jgi:hypothetical protein